jgi:hypothetical protein
LAICVLSLEEAGRLEHYGIWPSCKSHRHMSKADAATAVSKDETHRFVGGPDTAVAFASAIVPVCVDRIWSPVQCHHESGRAIMGMRTWGLKPLR